MPGDDVFGADIVDKLRHPRQEHLGKGILGLVPGGRSAIRVGIRHVVPDMHDRFTGRAARRVEVRRRDDPDQRVIRNLAVADIVEEAAEVIQPVRHQLGEVGVVDVASGLELERLVERGVDGEAGGRRDLGALGGTRDRRVDAYSPIVNRFLV